MSLENKNKLIKKENKSYFDYENLKLVEHFDNSNNQLYSSICFIVLLISMVLYSIFSNNDYFKTTIQFESLSVLFKSLASFFQ
jgi:hypothetical protein